MWLEMAFTQFLHELSRILSQKYSVTSTTHYFIILYRMTVVKMDVFILDGEIINIEREAFTPSGSLAR